MPDPMPHTEVSERLLDLDDWTAVDDALHARFDPPDVPTAARLLAAVLEVAEEMDHHPDADLRWRRLRFRVTSHDAGGVTPRDFRLARAISRLAREHGARAMDAAPTVVEVGIDTTDAGRIRGFWAAALGLEDVAADALVLQDAERLGPRVWFQVSDGPATGRNRVHLDVSVPTPQDAAERGAAIEAAGGELADDTHAPAWWVYRDADGNEACICTPFGRA